MPDLTTARDVLSELNDDFDLDGSVEHHDEELESVSLYFDRSTGIEATVNIWLEENRYAVETNVWKDEADDDVRYWTHLSPTLVSRSLLRPTIEGHVQDVLTMGEWDLTHKKSLEA